MKTYLHREEDLIERLKEELEDKIQDFFGEMYLDTDEAADEIIDIMENLILIKYESIKDGYITYLKIPEEDKYDFIDREINLLTPETLRATGILKIAYEAHDIISDRVKGLKDWDLEISKFNKDSKTVYYLRNIETEFEFGEVLARITKPNSEDETAVITTREGAILFCLGNEIEISEVSNIKMDELLEDEIEIIKDFISPYLNLNSDKEVLFQSNVDKEIEQSIIRYEAHKKSLNKLNVMMIILVSLLIAVPFVLHHI